ncbi:HD domain-containing phosphohydrolase [Colwellia ponticola]|uniref:HD domain-containing protein n=1 Tax=Colwellia ponticola TaxID=2304625 RepID=A0A8H2JM90_9GAMM|nr:HD domain-containing phosphohydrolase [Colwellia ponticola]TMM46435.1 HD domain-containing protein [Colwellia ponticola]
MEKNLNQSVNNNYLTLENTTFLSYVLLSLIAIISVATIYRLITNDIFQIVINSFFLVLLLSFYFVHKKYRETFLIANTLIIITYLILLFAACYLENQHFLIILFCLIPLFSFILLPTLYSLTYTLITLITAIVLLIVFSHSTSPTLNMRFIVLYTIISLFLYYLNRSRQCAWDKTNLHINKLHEDIKEGINQATKDYELTLISMVKMLESRDAYTAGHSERVARYSKLIAQKLGLNTKQCELVYRAGQLHDIGKIVTPDNILLKPNHLTHSEYELIKEHVQGSYDLLANIPMFKAAAEIIICHHEHHDGKGYPNGLKADEIPLLSQIMIIADAFDAMTTSRIYKSRKSAKQALIELDSLAGSQFNPDITPIAIEALTHVTIEENTSQLPTSLMGQERLNYFFKDQLTKKYNKEYLTYCVKNRQFIDHDHYLIVELKEFSQYNRRYGWSEGDNFLIAFANNLEYCFSDTLIYRVHGDTFILISLSAIDTKVLITKTSDLFINTGIKVSVTKTSLTDVLNDINSL